MGAAGGAGSERLNRPLLVPVLSPPETLHLGVVGIAIVLGANDFDLAIPIGRGEALKWEAISGIFDRTAGTWTVAEFDLTLVNRGLNGVPAGPLEQLGGYSFGTFGATQNRFAVAGVPPPDTRWDSYLNFSDIVVGGMAVHLHLETSAIAAPIATVQIIARFSRIRGVL